MLIEQAEGLTARVQDALKGAGFLLPSEMRALIRDMCGLIESMARRIEQAEANHGEK